MALAALSTAVECDPTPEPVLALALVLVPALVASESVAPSEAVTASEVVSDITM